MLEKEFQHYIYKNLEVQQGIKEILELEATQYDFQQEIEFINGITSDFILIDKSAKKIGAIIECKQANIGVTDYVRGIGQLLQYEFFQEKGITPKKFSDIKYNNEKHINALIVPSDFIKTKSLNIGRFKYPKTTRILEVHTKNHMVREIHREELDKLDWAQENEILAICQYYIRDNRLFEIFILLQILIMFAPFKTKGQRISRKRIENFLLTPNIKAINNNNWRNAFITLSNLGFIGNDNFPFSKAMQFSNMEIGLFVNMIYENYISFFIDEIMEILVEQSTNNIATLSNQEILKAIRTKYKSRDILYLTESEGRYISSWLNIMRDDLGCIDFQPRKAERIIKYIPSKLNTQARIEEINKNAQAFDFCTHFSNNKREIMKLITDGMEQYCER